MSSSRLRRATTAIVLALLATFLLSGCLEQLSSARIPAGATRNFLYFLVHNEQADAMAYWAPDHIPPDAATQVAQASATLQHYTLEIQKTDSVTQADGSMLVTLQGRSARLPGTPSGATAPLFRARLIEIGPGWRLTEFHLLCCQSP